ncbi:MAG: hypothetical protein WD740_02045, partial [Anaerolineales bacterium]
QSKLSTISGDMLFIMYEAEGIYEKSYITRGVMSYHIHGSPPQKLVGSFSDSTPALHSGPITLFKSRAEYKRRLAKLLKLARNQANTGLITQALQDPV